MQTCCQPGTMTVVCVGQGPRDRTLLSEYFRGPRWRVLHADDVRSANELLSRADVNAVISDVHLRDGSWLDIRSLSNSSGHNPPPTIVATATIDRALWADALSRGAYDILVKPFERQEVMHVVQSACLCGLQAHRPVLHAYL